MFAIRDARLSDLDQIHEVARHLDTVNLPDDRQVISQLIERSEQAFGGLVEPMAREYMFVLEDLERKRVLGTCMIHAQHGTRRAAHVYYEIAKEEHYSQTLDKYFVHRVLRLGYDYNGPTEIGGLILLPEFRGHAESLGRLLSYVRFLYIGMYRDKFRDELLSELLPPLGEDGTSLLWENLGRHFTGLTYQEADRLSSTNKEFIQALFPQGVVYTRLLSREVQDIIGVVGPGTKGVEKMLRRIGFTYANRIDPFDGGPHFSARTDDVTLVKNTRWASIEVVDTADEGRPYALIASAHATSSKFRAIGTRVRLFDDAPDKLGLTSASCKRLDVQPGERVAYIVP